MENAGKILEVKILDKSDVDFLNSFSEVKIVDACRLQIEFEVEKNIESYVALGLKNLEDYNAFLDFATKKMNFSFTNDEPDIKDDVYFWMIGEQLYSNFIYVLKNDGSSFHQADFYRREEDDELIFKDRDLNIKIHSNSFKNGRKYITVSFGSNEEKTKFGEFLERHIAKKPPESEFKFVGLHAQLSCGLYDAIKNLIETDGDLEDGILRMERLDS